MRETADLHEFVAVTVAAFGNWKRRYFHTEQQNGQIQPDLPVICLSSLCWRTIFRQILVGIFKRTITLRNFLLS
jgi:hypothetical protein